LKNILAHGELVLADKHEYMYVIVAKKDADVSTTKLPGCEEVTLKDAPSLPVTGL